MYLSFSLMKSTQESIYNIITWYYYGHVIRSLNTPLNGSTAFHLWSNEHVLMRKLSGGTIDGLEKYFSKKKTHIPRLI